MPEQTPVEGWFNYAQQLPENAPDVLYDAQRDKYFDAVVRPWAYQNGYSPEETRQEFMKRTERLDKAAFPRIELGAKSAARALIDPIAGATGNREVQAYLKDVEEKAALETTRQGINPAPYAMIGSMAGQLPYWYAGMELAGLAAGAVVPEAVTGVAEATAKLAATRKLFNVAAGAMVQGSYDAAKAEDGHRMLEGSLGALEGGAGMAVFEYAKPLWQILRGKFGISEDVAKAIEATTKGVADEAQTAEAAKVVEASPDVAKVVADAIAAQVKAGKKGGRPRKSPLADTSQKAVSVEVASNPQQELAALQAENARLKGQQVVSPIEPIAIKPEEIPQAADIISQVLDKGGSLEAVNGHPVEVNELLRQVDNQQLASGTYDTPLELRGEGPQPNIILPAWIQDNIDQLFQHAESLGIVQQIEDLSAQRLTASQVATQVNVPGDALDRSRLVRAVRNKLGIPSMKEPAEFEAWLQKHKSTALVDIPPKPGYNEGMATPENLPEASTWQKDWQQKLQKGYLAPSEVPAVGAPGTQFFPGFVNSAGDMSFPLGTRGFSDVQAALKYVRSNTSINRGEWRILDQIGRTVVDSKNPVEGLSYLTQEQNLELSPTLPANPLIASLRKVLLDPKLTEVQKSASRVRLQRLSPETVQEVDAMLAKPGAVDLSSLAAAPGEVQGVSEELALAQEASRKKAQAEGVGQPNRARLGLEDVSEYDQLEVLKSGKVRDKLSGRVYANADEALRAKGLSAPERFATEEPPGSSRRSFLKQTAGAAGSLLPKGALGPEEAAKLQGALKAADAGNKTAFGLIKELLDRALDYNDEGFTGEITSIFKDNGKFFAKVASADMQGKDIVTVRDVFDIISEPLDALEIAIRHKASSKVINPILKELKGGLSDRDVDTLINAKSEVLEVAEKSLPGIVDLAKKLKSLDYNKQNLARIVANDLQSQGYSLEQIAKDLDSQMALKMESLTKQHEDWLQDRAKQMEQARRPTGMELQRTPEWEPGPYGPGQFQRASKMRFAADQPNVTENGFNRKFSPNYDFKQLVTDRIASGKWTPEELALSIKNEWLSGGDYRYADVLRDIKSILARPSKFATEESPGGSRRSFLKRIGGAAASSVVKGDVATQANLEGPLKAALEAAQRGHDVSKNLMSLVGKMVQKHLDAIMDMGGFDDGGAYGRVQEVFQRGKNFFVKLKVNSEEPLLVTRSVLDPGQDPSAWLSKALTTGDKVLIRSAIEEMKKFEPDELLLDLVDDKAFEGLREHLSPEEIKTLENQVATAKKEWDDEFGEKIRHLQENGITRQQEMQEEARTATQARRSGTLTPGSELQRTPEWELGPYGPGQFQRASKMRYADGVEGEGAGVTNIAERPTQTRITGQLANQTLPPGTAAGVSASPNTKPTIYYRNPNPTNMFHEGLHAGIGYLDLAKDIDTAVRSHPTGSLMQAVFDSNLQKLYGPTWPEEAYVYAASAVRTKNSPILDRFIDADTDRATVLKWIADNTQELLQGVATKADSVHKLVAERRLKEVLRRSTGELSTIARDSADLVGDELRMDGGKYVLTDRDATSHVFDDRDSLVGFLESRYSEPLSAPQLVDESLLPADLPRYAADSSSHSLGRTPVNTTPPPPELMAKVQGPKGGRIVGGVQAFSNLARPFYAWLDTVARKNEWPELYTKFKALDLAEVDRQNFERPYRQVLSDVFKGVKANRRDDFYRWLEASTEDKPKVEQELHLSDAEIGKLNKLRNEFYDPLYTQFGISPLNYIESYAPRMRTNGFDPDAIKATGGPGLTPTEVDFFAKHVRSGELDPKDTDLLRVSDAYLRLGSREKHLSGPIEEAAKLVNMKTPGGEFVTGSLQPLLKRHIEAVRGIPDYTNRMIDGAANAAKETINDFLESYNKKVPGMMQIEPIEATPRDIMSKWILFSYAGGLAGRPMVVARDFLTTFITGYPILGGKYLAIGAKKAFETEGAWKTALEAGALLEHNPLRSIYSAGEGGVATGATKLAEASLAPLQWGNNVARLVSFWGHTEKALDAMKEFATSGNVKKLVRESAMTFLDESLQKSFVKEIASSTPEQAENIAHRIAKELTEVEHWNYRTGANPGIYRYTLGRLFGQYGTWPLNYIEYIRRIVANGDKVETAKALTRLAIAHGAIIAAGEASGIDTAQWVFTQPMAYGGGPLFQAVVNIPGTMDFESYRGAEARKEVVKPFFPGLIPGGLAAERLHKALVSSDPEVYKILLGFVPLKSQEKDKFWHQIVP